VPIVVDTNVFVGACLGRDASADVIAGCLEGRFLPLMSAALLAEHEDVLGREEVFARSRISSKERSELLDIYLGTCRWTRIYFGWRPNLRDEGDNHLIELALAGGAGAIVSHNLRDLRSHELKFPDLALLTPGQFLKARTEP
jgi:putative PIN family toxin of toxin-antitoxin system